jgi:hypothetical protein
MTQTIIILIILFRIQNNCDNSLYIKTNIAYKKTKKTISRVRNYSIYLKLSITKEFFYYILRTPYGFALLSPII